MAVKGATRVEVDGRRLMQQEVSEIAGAEFRLQGVLGVDPELTRAMGRDHVTQKVLESTL